MTGRVVVVGAGASGVLLTAALARRWPAGCPGEIVLLDRTGTFGPGIAYQSAFPEPVLNVPAGKLAAHPDRPDEFVYWARADGRAVNPGTFLPRSCYGRYLCDVLADATRRAPIDVRALSGGVRDLVPADAAVCVELDNGSVRTADHVVLAVGSPPPVSPTRLDPGVAEHPRYIADPWSDPAWSRAADGSRVLVLGTGLTMVDVALAVTARGPRTRVVAVSRHGLLPRRHGTVAPDEVPFDLSGGVPGPSELSLLLRSCVGRPERWRAAVDAIRPHTQRIWRSWSVSERRRFLERYSRFWDVHRHRLPPCAADRIEAIRDSGALEVHTARVTEVRVGPGGFDVEVLHGDGARRWRRCDWVVNATGGATVVDDRTAGGLAARLLARGVVRTDALRLGLDTTSDGRAVRSDGTPDEAISVIGPLRRGTLWESTAIPEIRAQAATLADVLVRDVLDRHRRPPTLQILPALSYLSERTAPLRKQSS